MVLSCNGLWLFSGLLLFNTLMRLGVKWPQGQAVLFFEFLLLKINYLTHYWPHWWSRFNTNMNTEGQYFGKRIELHFLIFSPIFAVKGGQNWHFSNILPLTSLLDGPTSGRGGRAPRLQPRMLSRGLLAPVDDTLRYFVAVQLAGSLPTCEPVESRYAALPRINRVILRQLCCRSITFFRDSRRITIDDGVFT